MKPVRNNQIYTSDKVIFYAHILAKAKCSGTQADMTIDNLIDCELIDKWEREHPELVLAYEKNCELKQQNKKAYEKAESDIIRLIAPVPEGQKTPAVARETKNESPASAERKP